MFQSMRNRREQEEEMSKAGRLPPGQSLTQKFPVLHYGPVPSFEPSTWEFRVWGEIEKERSWNWAEFSQLPKTKVTMDIHCVTRWSKFDTDWEGVSLGTLVEEGLIKLKPTAKFIIQHAEYGYTTNLPLEVGLAENFLMATHFNGESLTPEHGFPLRGVVGFIIGKENLFVPYLWKGAKWLRGLEFTKEDHPGFWEQAGYHNEADVWKEQRFGR